MSGSVGEVARAKVEVALSGGQRADAAASAVARRLVEVVRDNLAGAALGEDPEYLHQLRIAVRRTRTVQRQFRKVFPALELPGLRADFRWLQRATGVVRDLDVHVEEFDALAEMVPAQWRADLRPMRSVLTDRAAAAQERLVVVLDGDRVGGLLDDWERLLESLVELGVDDRPAAREPIGSLSAERISKVLGRIVEQGSDLGAESSAEELHALRKRVKELRYLLELFGVPLLDGEVVDPLVRAAKGLQELLGRHQDRVVQVEMIQALAPEVARRDGGPAACLAMGVLAERLVADELEVRAEFPEAFAVLADPELRVRFDGAVG